MWKSLAGLHKLLETDSNRDIDTRCIGHKGEGFRCLLKEVVVLACSQNKKKS